MKKLGTKILETERLILRKIVENDYKEAYHLWCSDQQQVIYTLHGVHENIDITKRVYDRWIDEYNDESVFRWIIVLKENNQQIGTIDINNEWSRYGSVEPGYIISREYWGKGYATEATKAVMEYMFRECEIETFYSEFMEDNIASERVMQKCGMIKDGVLRNRCEDKNGKRQNLISYSITKKEFFENNK